MTRDRDREVKFQKNSRESRLSQGTAARGWKNILGAVNIILASGKIYLSDGKIILAGRTIILAGGKINLADGKINLTSGKEGQG